MQNKKSAAGGLHWEGPRYRRPSRRNQDVLFVLRHLLAIMKSNASLSGGLAAAIDDGLSGKNASAVQRSRIISVAMMVLALLGWNAVPAVLLIEPSRESWPQYVALGMIVLEVVTLLGMIWHAWRRADNIDDTASLDAQMRRGMRLGQSVDRILGVVALLLGLGACLVISLSGEVYFGALGALLILAVTYLVLRRMRGRTTRGGPFERAFGEPSRPGVKRIAALVALRQSLGRGATLGEAARQLSNFFPAHVSGRILAAEQSGRLTATIAEIADELEIAARQDRDKTGGRVYLFLLLILQLAISTFLLVKIVPIFAEIAEEFNSNLPTQMQQLISAGDFVLYRWPHVITALATTVVLCTAVYRYAPGAKWLWARLLLSLPVAGAARHYHAAAQIARMLGDLISAGMPLHDALALCAASGVGPVQAGQLRRWIALAENGQSLSECALSSPMPAVIPTGFAAAAQLGEASGAIRDALHHAAEHYAECGRRADAVREAIAFPLLLAPMAFVTFFITSAFFHTIAGVSDALFYSL